MMPGFEAKQAAALFMLLFRRPGLTLRAFLRLLARGLAWLAENPDLAWARHLISGGGPAPFPAMLALIAEEDRPVFSLLVAGRSSGNIPSGLLRSVYDLDVFREMTEGEFRLTLQVVQIDVRLIDRIKAAVAEEKGLDAFYVFGREVIGGLSEGSIRFSPVLPEAAVGGSLEGDEILSKFGPRFGLSREDPVEFSKVTRGLRLALGAPFKRRRMRKALAAFDD